MMDMTSLTLRIALVSGALCLSAFGNTAFAQVAEPTVAVPIKGNVPTGAKDSFDPVYNVCRGKDPRCYHPWVDDREEKVLLYTRTLGPRHANPACLPVAVTAPTAAQVRSGMSGQESRFPLAFIRLRTAERCRRVGPKNAGSRSE